MYVCTSTGIDWFNTSFIIVNELKQLYGVFCMIGKDC